MDTWTLGLASFVGAALAMGLGIAWRSYFGEKGRNLATKQDIGAITTKIEAIRTEYMRGLEESKSAWAAHSSLFTYRYQREYDMLRELSEALVKVKNAAEFFSNYPNLPESMETEDSKKYRDKQVNALARSLQRLQLLREQRRPFYPQEIYDALGHLAKAAQQESSYLMAEPFGLRRWDYGKEAEENAAAISSSADLAIESIRRRVIAWETFLPS